MEAILTAIMWIAIAGVMFYVFWWAIGALDLPAPFNKIARAVLIIAAMIVAIYLLLGVMPPFPVRR